MKKITFLSAIALIILLLQSCDFIAGVFQTGFWAGIILVFVIIVIIVILFSRRRR